MVNALVTASVGSSHSSVSNTDQSAAVRPKPTYIGQLGIVHGPCSVVIDPRSIHVDRKLYKWSANTTLIRCGQWMTVNVTAKRHVTVVVQSDVVLSVIRHLIRRPDSPEVEATTDWARVDHLGFYVENGSGFSEFTHGIIGLLI